MNEKPSFRERPLVLVADDDPIVRLMMGKALKQAGFAVETAEDGTAALSAATRCQPDIVLLDVLMPKMDGFVVLSELRKKPEGLHLPVVMVTGLDDTESVRRAYATGATDFITKPIHWPNLGFHVQYLLRAHRTAVELRQNKQYLQLQFDRMPIGSIVWDPDFHVASWNPAAEGIFGFTASEAMGKHAFGLIVPQEARSHVHDIWQRLLQGDLAANGINENLTKTGRKIVCEWNNTPLRQEDGSIMGVLSMVQDITARKRAEEKLQLAGKVFENSGEIIVVTDPRMKVVFTNPAFTRITGFSQGEILGQDIGRLESNQEGVKFHQKLKESLENSGSWQGEILGLRKDGGNIPFLITINVLRDEDGEIANYVGIGNDISQLKDAQDKLRRLAFFDPLTGLPNRTLLHDRLRHSLNEAMRCNSHVALLYLDLDNFKEINDTFGHRTGDQVLRQVSSRLRDLVRRSDTFARMGGDEFTFVMNGLAQPEHSMNLSRRIREALSSPFKLDEGEIFVTASIGIALYPADCQDADEMIQKADTALSCAKNQGKNQYQYFSAEMDRRIRQRLAMQTELRHALERDEFIPFYQPKVDLRSGKIDGLEVLVRWLHPEKGIVLPGSFIPLAEETGLIVPIGEKVMKMACRQARAWQQEGLPPMHLAINLSAVQLRREDMVERLGRVMAETGIDPHWIELEITESAVMENPEKAAEMLQVLKSNGISHITMDDFGTGYSSLNYLRRFPVDTLKIDYSFIKDLPDNPESVVLVRTIITMARSFNLKVIAEGVERKEQLDLLRRLDCDAVQGFYFFKPMSGDDMTKYLTQYGSNLPSDPMAPSPGLA
jgi:diguanylate cyclase (GGDEF)-like protein/PAS domain S-box-containing protein